MLKQHFKTYQQMHVLIKERCHQIMNIIQSVQTAYDVKTKLNYEAICFEGNIENIELCAGGIRLTWHNDYDEQAYFITDEMLFLSDEEIKNRESEHIKNKIKKQEAKKAQLEKEWEKLEYHNYLTLKEKYENKL